MSGDLVAGPHLGLIAGVAGQLDPQLAADHHQRGGDRQRDEGADDAEQRAADQESGPPTLARVQQGCSRHLQGADQVGRLLLVRVDDAEAFARSSLPDNPRMTTEVVADDQLRITLLPSSRLAANRPAQPLSKDERTRALAHDPDARFPDVPTLQAELEALMRGGGWFRERVFPAGTTIVREGEPGDAAYIVARGTCDVFKRAGERSVHLRRIGPGEVFGETAILTSGRRSATVVAVDEVAVLIVTREALERELDSRGWLGPLVRALAERFREADDERARLRGLAMSPAGPSEGDPT